MGTPELIILEDEVWWGECCDHCDALDARVWYKKIDRLEIIDSNDVGQWEQVRVYGKIVCGSCKFVHKTFDVILTKYHYEKYVTPPPPLTETETANDE